MYYGAGFNLFGYNSNVIFPTQKGKGPPNTTLFANLYLHIPQDSLCIHTWKWFTYPFLLLG